MYEYAIAKVERVVDGDTLDLLFDVGFSMFRKERVRLHGIDAPETSSRNPQEKVLARDAKDFVIAWIMKQGALKARTMKDDKYGRMLANVYGDDGVCLNEEMVSKGYAWAYDGGTKVKDIPLLLERRKANPQ